MIRLFFLLAFLIGFQPVNPEEPVLRTHAHNDYLHEHPLYDALSYGFLSVEADILLHENKLYVGHDQIDLRNKSLVTLEDLYLNPLFERFKKNGGTLYPNYPGIFYLWIDIKYDGKEVIKILNNLT